jgi:hypothetical protein
MAVVLQLTYEDVIELVEQLPEAEIAALMARLLERKGGDLLLPEVRKALYHASILRVPVNEAPSIRREDWYGDDGR